MQSEFYKAGYDAALEKIAIWGQVAGALGRGATAASKWLGGVGANQGAVKGMMSSASKPMNWVGGKMQGAAQGLSQSFGNLAAAPGKTLWQGAGNFGKNMLGMGNAATTSGVLGRGAMGYGLLRGATGGFGAGPQPGPGQLPGPGQIQ